MNQKIKYPVDITKTFVDFVLYLKYRFGRTSSKDFLCKYCSNTIRTENFKITNTFNIEINCSNTGNSYIFDSFHFSKVFSDFNFCQCDVDTIIKKVETKIQKSFVSILYWLISIDQELYFILVDKGNQELQEYPKLYYEFQNKFRFPKLRAHNYWKKRHHVEPEFIFRILKRKNDSIELLADDNYPDIIEFESIFNQIWKEIINWFSLENVKSNYPIDKLINVCEGNFKKEIESLYEK